MLSSIKTILISRTDSIGDVVLTLPMAAIIKAYYPGIKIGVIGRSYTKAVIDTCSYVDSYIDIEDFYHKKILIDGLPPDAIVHVFPLKAIAKRAKQLKIPLRIGTVNRLYHWGTCNKLVKLSRKNSTLHEAQLNIKLLTPFQIPVSFSLKQIPAYYGFENISPLDPVFKRLIDSSKFNLILHPKSQGSGREWGLDNMLTLIRLLDKKRVKIFISGTSKERPLLEDLFSRLEENAVTDITGMMSLDQFISFIGHCDGLLAASTGPLHIAAALGKCAIGLFAPMRPIHPGRWMPLGKDAHFLVLNKECNDCKKKAPCHCIKSIQPMQVLALLEKKI